MKTNILSFILLIATCFVAQNLSAYDFSAENEDGVMIYYNYINQSDRTFCVTYYSSTFNRWTNSYSYSSPYKDDVKIPTFVERNGVIFTVTGIDKHAFENCSNLITVDIPNTVNFIDEYAFGGCTKLTSISIPNSVVNIGNYAFASCTKLTSVDLGDHVNTIGKYAFYGCVELSSLLLPNSVTSIGYYSFSDCSSLTSINIGNSLSKIESCAFKNCSGFTSIELPNSVTSIGDGAFDGCSGLTSITIPNSVTSIGDGAFDGCSGLTSVTIPNSVISIEKEAFKNCNIKYLNYNAKVELSRVAFPSFSSIIEVIIGDDVPSISAGCFSGSINLHSISFGKLITNIKNSTFKNCTGFTSFLIPNTITSIGDSVFYGCSNLLSINIANSVNSIGRYAFSGCEKMERVEINDLESWFKISFGNETANPLYYGHYLNLNNKEIHDLVIPNTISSVNPYVLYNATCLTSIEIPSSVTSIGKKAFYGCSNVTSVKSNITNVFKTGASAFEGCDKAVLYVPEGLLISYSGREDWNRIAKIEESESGYSISMSCNSRGRVVVNGETIFTNKMGEVRLEEDSETTLEFIPNANCKLEQVIMNGFDITATIDNNILTAQIPEGASIIVTFSKENGDINHDGQIDISDVVALVNIILGQ